MKEFECPICGSKELYNRRNETIAQRMYPPVRYGQGEFDLGKEEVCDCDFSRLECGNDHPLLLKDDTECDTFEDYEKWQAEQEQDENKHITILQHDISYFLRDTDLGMEVDDSSKEHVEHMISQGYSEGDLFVTDFNKDITYSGYWKIVK